MLTLSSYIHVFDALLMELKAVTVPEPSFIWLLQAGLTVKSHAQTRCHSVKNSLSPESEF